MNVFDTEDEEMIWWCGLAKLVETTSLVFFEGSYAVPIDVAQSHYLQADFQVFFSPPSFHAFMLMTVSLVNLSFRGYSMLFC